jgi:hypothetical protein
MRLRSKLLVLIVCLAVIVGLGLRLGRTTVGYGRLLARDEQYCSRLAIACDGLLSRYANQAPVKLSGNDIRSVPEILENLNPSLVIVQTNSVMILVGGGFDAYQVLWSLDKTNGSVWRLIANREGTQSRILYSRPQK